MESPNASSGGFDPSEVEAKRVVTVRFASLSESTAESRFGRAFPQGNVVRQRLVVASHQARDAMSLG
jgi:hypothetical protein